MTEQRWAEDLRHRHAPNPRWREETVWTEWEKIYTGPARAYRITEGLIAGHPYELQVRAHATNGEFTDFSEPQLVHTLRPAEIERFPFRIKGAARLQRCCGAACKKESLKVYESVRPRASRISNLFRVARNVKIYNDFVQKYSAVIFVLMTRRIVTLQFWNFGGSLQYFLEICQMSRCKIRCLKRSERTLL